MCLSACSPYIVLGDKQSKYESAVVWAKTDETHTNIVRYNAVVSIAVCNSADHKCKQDIVAVRIK